MYWRREREEDDGKTEIQLSDGRYILFFNLLIFHRAMCVCVYEESGHFFSQRFFIEKKN